MTRLDWLEDQLEDDNLSPALRARYEKEANDIVDRQTLAIKKRQARDKERAEIRAKILANDQDFIATFGAQEFGQDYEIVQEKDDFVVYSHVARDDQEHRRVHASQDAADADLRYLFYNRLYDKYVRTEELNNLTQLVENK